MSADRRVKLALHQIGVAESALTWTVETGVETLCGRDLLRCLAALEKAYSHILRLYKEGV